MKTESDDKDAYKKFPKLLQHIEADCVIDFVTKKISEVHPEIPIFTIHDSICTIDIDSDVIYRLIKKYISEYSGGILPSIKEEFWGLPIKYPKAA
ncbi:hypothetical protein [Empedobacter sedimenti]|uniref:hypothetical protein n=1 Tax=Empedobacter sedimenti TaxID=3042610 RepID=UPI0024A69F62|nr:hypothetical protein [Empedobacter sedimenti]